MIKVEVLTTAGRKSDMFEEHITPKEILERFEVDYSVATNSLDGVRLGIADMNKSLKELGVGDKCRISSIVKIDNAASVEISGASAVLVSDVALEDWKKVQKYAPEMMKIYDEDDEVVFKVAVCGGPGSANKYGICFGGHTNEGGKATVTILLDDNVDDKVAAVKEVIGTALLDLNRIEEAIPETLEEIAKKDAELEALIVSK